MGKVNRVVEEKLIPPNPDRQANYLKVYENSSGELVVRFRNLKILLIGDQKEEWVCGFKTALENYKKTRPFREEYE